MVSGVRGEHLLRWSSRVEEALVKDGGEVCQRTGEQVAGQSYLRPSRRVSALGEGGGEANHGRQ